MAPVKEFVRPYSPEHVEVLRKAAKMLGQSGRWTDCLKTSEVKPGPCQVWQADATSPDIDQVAALARLLFSYPQPIEKLIENLFSPFAVTVVETGQVAWSLPIEQALIDGLLPAIRKDYDYLPKISVLSPEPQSYKLRLRRSRKSFEEDIADALTSRQPVVLLVDESRSLPPSVSRSVTHWVPLTPLNWRMVTYIHHVVHKSCETHIDGPTQHSFDGFGPLNGMPPKTLALALRHPNFDDVIAEVRDSFLCKPVNPNQGALSEVKGLGASREFLEQLSNDVASWHNGDLAWSEIPRGILLYGPPGTGKTFTAGKMAEQMGVHFLPTSYADWQKQGHLGDFMKAMKRSFDDAHENAPSLLFVDEIDSFGDRSTATGENAGYVRSAVNALLEQLDGAEKTEGVVVVAACNSFDQLDAALTRSGRFDCKIPLGLPSKQAFSEILTAHVGTKVSTDTIKSVAAHLVGFTGADAAAIVRSASSLARSGGHDLSDEDLIRAALQFAPSGSEEDLRRAAIHEAGHAVVGYKLGQGVPIRAQLKAQGGSVTFTSNELYPTASQLEAMLCTALAGRSAEMLFLGEVSAGAGGGKDSDLATATLLASQMELQLGLGSNPLIWKPVKQEDLNSVLSDATTTNKVNQRLQNAETKAKKIISKDRNLVLKLATRLLEDRQLEQEELVSFFNPSASEECTKTPKKAVTNERELSRAKI